MSNNFIWCFTNSSHISPQAGHALHLRGTHTCHFCLWSKEPHLSLEIQASPFGSLPGRASCAQPPPLQAHTHTRSAAHQESANVDSRLLSGSNKLHTEPMKPFVGLVFPIFNMRALDGSVTMAFSSTGFLWISDCKEPPPPRDAAQPLPREATDDGWAAGISVSLALHGPPSQDTACHADTPGFALLQQELSLWAELSKRPKQLSVPPERMRLPRHPLSTCLYQHRGLCSTNHTFPVVLGSRGERWEGSPGSSCLCPCGDSDRLFIRALLPCSPRP